MASEIDLHCHSSYSDGALHPSALLKKAQQAQLKVLALTDHDTIAGLKPLQEAASDSGVTVINGIEISVRWKQYDIHVVGLNFVSDNPVLCALIEQQNAQRIARAQEIGACLEACGIEDAFYKATQLAGHERVGRLHFSQVLIDEGIVKDRKAAFRRFLGPRCPAYVPTTWLSLEEAVSGITEAGGLAVLAHPLKYRLTRTKLRALLEAFKAVGGAGMEVVSGEMTLLEVNEMAHLSSHYNLLASTGSDYHADAVSRVSLGQQRVLPVNCIPIWHQWLTKDFLS